MNNISSGSGVISSKNRVKPGLRLTLKHIERQIKDKDIEVGYFVDKQGNIKHVIEGSADQIYIPQSLQKELKDCYFTHNHPMESRAVLSKNDITSAFYGEIREVRCVSNTGEIAVLRFPKNPTFKQAAKLQYQLDKQSIKNAPKMIGLIGKKLALKAQVKLGILDNEYAKNKYFTSIDKFLDTYKSGIEKGLKKAVNLTIKYMKV